MYNDTLKYAMALAMTEGVGSVVARKLLSVIETPEEVFRESKKNLSKIPFLNTKIIDLLKESSVFDKVNMELEFMEKHRISAVFCHDKAFPIRLNECYDAPIILYYKGNIKFNSPKIISIVGTRRVTPYGLRMTEKIINGLAEMNQDVLIISGLAYGIDIAAHRFALRNNLSTVAVLAHGLDTIYPTAHNETAIDMQHDGGIITEFRQSTIPEAANFVKRNRIVAGMADATIVVESGVKGGAMITANLAFSYDREVMAVPGNADSYYSKGCNWLIKTQKASVIESADDLVELMNWSIPDNKKPVQKKLFIELNPEEQKIYDLIIKEKQVSVNHICIETGLHMSAVSMCLLNLEMQAIVKSMPGNMYALL